MPNFYHWLGKMAAQQAYNPNVGSSPPPAPPKPPPPPRAPSAPTLPRAPAPQAPAPQPQQAPVQQYQSQPAPANNGWAFNRPNVATSVKTVRNIANRTGTAPAIGRAIGSAAHAVADVIPGANEASLFGAYGAQKAKNLYDATESGFQAAGNAIARGGGNVLGRLPGGQAVANTAGNLVSKIPAAGVNKAKQMVGFGNSMLPPSIIDAGFAVNDYVRGSSDKHTANAQDLWRRTRGIFNPLNLGNTGETYWNSPGDNPVVNALSAPFKPFSYMGATMTSAADSMIANNEEQVRNNRENFWDPTKPDQVDGTSLRERNQKADMANKMTPLQQWQYAQDHQTSMSTPGYYAPPPGPDYSTMPKWNELTPEEQQQSIQSYDEAKKLQAQLDAQFQARQRAEWVRDNYRGADPRIAIQQWQQPQRQITIPYEQEILAAKQSARPASYYAAR